MRKTILFLACISILMMITACGPQQTTTTTTAGGDDITDISEAFTSNTPVKCTVNIEGYSSELWLKGESYRIEVTETGMHAISIFDGHVLHSWETSTNQGFKMDLDRMKEIARELGQEEPESLGYTREDIESLGTGLHCSRVSVPDSLFVPPSGVQFQDMTAMMEQMLQGFQE